jgi:protein-disulfide isomerase
MTHSSDASQRNARKRTGTLSTRFIGVSTIVTAAVVLPLGLATCNRNHEIRQDAASLASIPGVNETRELFAGIPQDGIALGVPAAPVTLTDFADLQCSHCRTFALTTLPVIVKDYVRTGKVRLVFRNLAFLGDDSVEAARMAGAMGLQNQQWTFLHLFFHSQGRTNSGYVTDAFLRSLARAVPSVNVEQAMSTRRSAAVDRELAEANEIADRFGIDGTPAFLIGKTGETPKVLELSSLRPEEFTKAIDELLKSN